jgi:8-oxo-dGTP pyrophosphatase MutT (NUDIX family)
MGCLINREAREYEVELLERKNKNETETMIIKNDIEMNFTLDSLIENTIYQFSEPEWGFPKGRRNFKEKNIECARREFEEETNILNNDYTIINMTPMEETYLASNSLKYKHIYYVSQIKDNHYPLNIDEKNMYQNIEIGDINWFLFEDAMKKIRDYNIEKKNILLNLHMNIKYTLLHFKKMLDHFLEKENFSA